MKTEKEIAIDESRAHLDRLKIAFDLVADPFDWRGPINAVVLVESMEASNVTVENIRDAIAHYTATEPFVTVLKIPTGAVLFQSAGYRSGPAGP